MALSKATKLVLALSLLSLVACTTTPQVEKRFGDSLQKAKDGQSLAPHYQENENFGVSSKELVNKLNAYVQGNTVQSAGKDKIAVDMLPGAE